MTIAEALKAADRVYMHFGCANGASVSLCITKVQARSLAGGAQLDRVYTHQDEEVDYEPTARWSFDKGALHLHFAT